MNQVLSSGTKDTLFLHPVLVTVFVVLILAMLVLDLAVLNQKPGKVSNKSAAIWTAVWVGLSMFFSVLIYLVMGFEKFSQFQAAYWIEKALSVDNLFVFILVFNFFNVPPEIHKKVLLWGILGALFFRAIFIFTGVQIINISYLTIKTTDGLLYLGNLACFHWPIPNFSIHVNIILLVFGVFLILAGIKSWFAQEESEENKDFSNAAGAKLIKTFFKVSKNYDGAKFFTFENGKRVATPLLVVLAVIEFSDLLFAVDSIPAIFAIAPNDPLILYSSNIFAILGLRAMYFLLANFIHMFSKLSYGLAIILTFIGLKMVIAPWIHISSSISLSLVAFVLVASVIWSLASKKEAT